VNKPGWVTELLQGVAEVVEMPQQQKSPEYFRNIMPIDVTEKLLLDWNRNNNPPLDNDVILKTVKSVYRYSPRLSLNNLSLNTSIYSPNDAILDSQRNKA